MKRSTNENLIGIRKTSNAVGCSNGPEKNSKGVNSSNIEIIYSIISNLPNVIGIKVIDPDIIAIFFVQTMK